MNIINFLQTSKIQNNKNIQKFASNSVSFKGSNAKDSFEKTTQNKSSEPAPEENISSRKEAIRRKYQKQLAVYEQKLEECPEVAFLYNPDITIAERKRMAAKSDNIFSFTNLAKHINTNIGMISAWTSNGLLEFERVDSSDETKFVNIEAPQNKEFLEKIQDKIPHTISGEELQTKYNFSKEAIRLNIKNGKMNVLGFDDIPSNIGPDHALFDIEDETNKKVIEDHIKLTPVPSKKYYKRIYNADPGEYMVPVQYLQKLGYGKASTLINMVNKGTLLGERVKLPAQEGEKPKYRTFVDISRYIKSEETLNALRKSNPDTDTIQDLAKSLGVRVGDIKEAIVNDELEIIKEYIFADDHSNIYIDKTNPKNAEFVDRLLFEKEIIEEQKALRRAELKQKRSKEKDPLASLRAKLVWSMCPNTRSAASYEAKLDGYASSLLAKEAEGEELTEKENIKLNSYRKKFWNRAGREEYKKAHAKTREILAELREYGLDGVEDENAKALIEKFLEDNSISAEAIRARIAA